MKLNSFTRISLLSLTITTLLLIGSSIDFSSKEAVQITDTDTDKVKGIRSLIDETLVAEVCLKASQNLQDIYAENKDTFDYEIKENKYADILRIFINDMAVSNIIPYWPRIIPFVVFILIAIFSIIGWLVCCCCCYCCCCPCCCCKQKENENCCRRCSFVVSLIMLGGIVAGAVAGLVYTSIFIEGINGMTCSVMTFYNELKNGETRTTTPRWLGMDGISNTITKTIDSVDVIQKESKEAYKADVLKGFKRFEKNLTDSFNDFQTKKLINPNPSTPDTQKDISPLYIEKYGPHTDKNTLLNQIYQEYDVVVNNGVKEVNKTQEMTTQIDSQADTIKQTLTEANSQITDLSGTFDNSIGSIVDQIPTYLDYINEYGNLILYLLFGLFLFIGIISLILVSVYVGKCCYCGRGVLHFFWNFFALFSIITFLVGSIFGIIGIVGEDGSSILAYIFSAENLKSDNPLLIGGSDTINTCLLEDGDLSKSLGLVDGDANHLDQLYQMSDTIKTTKAELQKYKTSQSIKAVNDQLTEIKNNFRLSNTEVVTSLTELNKYTNGNAPGTYQTGITQSKFDTWVASLSDCGKVSPPSCREIAETEGKVNAISDEYLNVDVSGGSYDSAKLATSDYFTRLNKYNTENEDLINDLMSNIDDTINKQYEIDVGQLDETLDNVDGVIKPLITVYGEVAGDNSIFSIINCKFLRKNLNIFISVMEKDLGNKTTVLAAIILAISFCETLSIIFVLIVLLRYKSQYIKKEPGNDDSSNNIIDPEPESNPEPQPVSDVPQQKQPEDIRVNSEEPKPQDLPVPILEKGDI